MGIVSVTHADLLYKFDKLLRLLVMAGMVLMAAIALPSVVVPAHALASNFYEMGYILQYCPLGFCGDYEYFNGAAGTLSVTYATTAATDTYNWALSLDNIDSGHIWFQAGMIVGLDPNNNFHSSPVFYVEIQTSSAYSFQTFPASSNSQHTVAICVGPSGLVCPWGSNSGVGLEARLDGSIVYNGNDPFSSGQGFTPGAFLEFHQATTAGIQVSGSWSYLVYSGGQNPWCGRSWGDWFCNDLSPTHSSITETPNPPTPYSIIASTQTVFTAGLLTAGGTTGGGGGGMKQA